MEAYTQQAIARALRLEPGQVQLRFLESVDSTNNELKRLALQGAPAHTAVVSRVQLAGRGRRGRSFLSQEGGVYLSMLLRPAAPAQALLHLTAMTAVAVRRAVARACGVQTQIKWTNDLVSGGKKLCGILTELGVGADGKTAEYVVIGVGVNCNQPGFSPELSDVALSLRQLCGQEVSCSVLAARMLEALLEMEQALFTQKEAWLREFSENCVTLGRRVRLARGNTLREAFAEGIDDQAALLVRYDDGSREAISSGEVSVRGMYGYQDDQNDGKGFSE